MAMSQRVGAFTEEHLQRIADADPSAIVMRPEYDLHEAWNPDEVEAIMDMHIRGEADPSSERVQRFKREHPIMAAKFADAELMANPRFVGLFRFMFEKRRCVARGGSSGTSAAGEVADRALHAVYTVQKEAEAAATDSASPAPHAPRPREAE